MHSRQNVLLVCMFASLLSAGMARADEKPQSRRASVPNFVLILADDLGYGDLGCYGQQVIQTPRLDQMAAEGLRFTNFYAGNTVCAPSRSVLMTGQHVGHTHVRGNAGGRGSAQSLRDQDVTVAEVLHGAGYYNALIGKWGLGEVDQPGFPLKQGFDRFYGYLNQTHAHNYYPRDLWDNDRQTPLANEVQDVDKGPGYEGFVGGAATKRIDYSHDLFVKEAEQFIRGQKPERPFFLYLALTIPHANNEGTRLTGNGAEVPDFGPYADRDWPDADKGQAAMITRMDADVGRILDLLRELNQDKNTLVFFSSDNGPHNEAGHNLTRFNPSGPLRGIKRSLTEGGIRVPGIAWWPGTIAAARTSDHVAYLGDWMATATELARVPADHGVDSISFVPTLLNQPSRQKQHEYLYWEFYEQSSRQAVRFGNWKAIRDPMLTGDIQVYDLAGDLGETTDLASSRPDLVEQAAGIMQAAHVPHPNWRVPNASRNKRRN